MSVGHAKFAHQLYNLQHMLDSEGETKDQKVLNKLRNVIIKHQQKHHMQSFNTKNAGEGNNPLAKRKHPNKDVGDPGEGGGAGSEHATDCVALRAKGYEVKDEDESGKYVME